MDARSAKASQSTLYKIYFHSVILQGASGVAEKDLILIKEEHELFINSGTSDWLSSWSLNHGDTANPSADTRRRTREWRNWTNAYVPLLDEGTFTDNRTISVIYSTFVLLIEL